MKRRFLIYWGVLPLGLLVLVAMGGRQEGGVGGSPTETLMVLFHSDQNGYLTPCGCAKPMIGGLPRRGTYIRSLPPTAALIKVDNGDLTHALNRQDELKAETIIEMYNELGYDALNLGEKDFRLGLPYLQTLQAKFRGTILCANVRKADGTPLFKEYGLLKREVQNQSVQIAVVGVISEALENQIRERNPEVKVEPASAALERLQEILPSSDVRILLYHGPKVEAEKLAERFPQFQMVVYAHGGDYTADPKERVGNTFLVNNGKDGKYVGQVVLSFAASWQVSEVKYIKLEERIKEDERLLQIKMAYLERVAAENLLEQVPKLPTKNGDTFTGSKSCAPCHPQAYEVWTGSRHAQAMQTLVLDKHDKDPECVICHVVGLDKVGGFVNMAETPHLKDVGCESCHGASQKHVQDPMTVKPERGGPSTCLQCHVPEHSPSFDFDTYWEKIKH